MGRFAFFCMQTSSWSPLFVKNAVFFLLDVFSSFVQISSDHRCLGSFLGLQFYSIYLLAYLLTIPNTCYYYWSVVELEVRDGDTLRDGEFEKCSLYS